jgi:hypothetical protein
MLLNELFNKSLPFKKLESSQNYVVYSFMAKDPQFTMMVEELEYIVVLQTAQCIYAEVLGFECGKDVWDFSFYSKEHNEYFNEHSRDNPYGILDTRNALPVLATVSKIFPLAIKEKNPNIVIMTADEPSRIKLYKRGVPALARSVGMNVKLMDNPKSPGGKMFVLLKPGVKIDDFD